MRKVDHTKLNQADKEAIKYSELARELEVIRKVLIDFENSYPSTINVHAVQRESASNLLHYIALRRHDLSTLQTRLSQQGLSSLGRIESHVLPNIDAVLTLLYRLGGVERLELDTSIPSPDFSRGTKLLHKHTNRLLGKRLQKRQVRIMVTMPCEAADNYHLIRDLLAQGMDCMRINCAHDHEPVWQAMIQHLRKAEREVGRQCRVVMDLAGPKLRTGPVEPGPAVVRIQPKRDEFGKVVAPALVWLFDESYGLVTPEEAEVCLPASSKWLNRLAKGDRIHFVDTSDRDRYLEVIHIEKHGVWAQSMNSAFVATGTILQHLSEHLPSPNPHETLIGVIPNIEGHLLLQCGDRLLLTPTMEPSTNAQLDKSGCVRRPARIGCTLPENFKDIRVGDSVWLDEGKIGGVVEQKDDSGLTIHILHARPNGEKLKGDKGINFPDSILRIPAMTKRDRINLRFVVEHADLVAMSFSSNRQDVVDLLNEIELIGNRRPGILLKIETRRGFENLPDMLLEAMKAPACGVIIARGDLAVEFGYQRLAEVQEEILRMCEAAHTPVILATQGLEKLAKQGIPSRVEISDTAMLNRAECVMLKKGTHILEAVEALDNILCRMQRQQNKKRSVVRELKLAKAFKSYA